MREIIHEITATLNAMAHMTGAALENPNFTPSREDMALIVDTLVDVIDNKLPRLTVPV